MTAPPATSAGAATAASLERQRRLTLLVGSFGSACTSFDLTLMFVLYPAVRSAHPGVSLTRMSFVLTVYTIVNAALLIPGGRLADRFGRRRAFLLGVSCFALGTTAAALSPSIEALIAARFFQSAGGALITPSSIGLVMSVYPPEKRSSALGVWSSVTSALSSSAPVLGSLAIRAGGWRWAYVLTLPLCLVCLTFGRRVLPREAADRKLGYPDLLGSAMIAVALASLAYAIVQTGTWGWFDRSTLLIAAIPVALVPLFVWRCRTHPNPVVDFVAVRAATGFGGVATYAIAIGVLYWGSFYVNVQLLQKGWQYSVVETGVRMVPLSISAVFLGRWVGRTIDRNGFRATLAPAALGYAAVMVGIALLAGQRPNMPAWIALAFCLGTCTNLLFIGANTAGAASAPVEALSVMTGIVQTMMRVGGVVGSALAVTLIGDTASGASERLQSTYLRLALMAVVASMAVFLLRERPTHRS